VRRAEAVIVGAGVAGLTTAICIAKAGAPVRVWAAEPPDRTTSRIAGAMWGPSFQEPADRVLRWTLASLDDFRALAAQAGTGVRMAPGRIVTRMPLGDEVPPAARVLPDLRPCPPEEVPDGFASGYRATVPLADMPSYLAYLRGRLAAAGGEVEVREVRSLAEVGAEASVVVNCTGLGARDLAGDANVRPARGQHVAVSNPGLEEYFIELTLGGEWTSFFPHPGRVVLGGNSVLDSWDREPDPAFTEQVLARCAAIEPRLRQATVLESVVGLRPDRPAVRVEGEWLAGDGGSWCVHNYGHGGHGVSLSWGCAREAARLALG
jgi:D-amino-acid oxidase